MAYRILDANSQVDWTHLSWEERARSFDGYDVVLVKSGPNSLLVIGAATTDSIQDLKNAYDSIAIDQGDAEKILACPVPQILKSDKERNPHHGPWRS